MEHEASEARRTGSKNGKDENAGRGRKRVSRACDRCRLKKDKCDALKPRCTPCTLQNQHCSYDPSVKKRGLPEGYVRALEKLWALGFSKIEGLENTIRHLAAQNSEVWNHEVTGDSLHAIWKDSSVLHELESLLSRTEQDHSGASGLKRKRGDEDSTPNEEPVSYNLEYRIASLLVGDEALQHPHLIQPQKSINMVEQRLSAAATSILDHYFTYTHCWFPIVEKHQIMRACYQNSKGHIASTAKGDTAALFAILAYTSRQLKGDSQMSNTFVSGVAMDTSVADNTYATARGLIPDENGPFELGHVQALLLLTLLEVGIGEWSKAWLLVGSASRIALGVGLQNNHSEKRAVAVMQSCCVLDTLIASHLMQPPHLRRADIQEIRSLEEDGSEEWDPWRQSGAPSIASFEPAFTIGCFNRLVEAAMILNDTVTCDLPSGDSRRTFFEGRLNLLNMLQERYPTPVASGTGESPHQIFLQLFHLTTTIAVLRQSFEGGAPEDPLAKLACETLVLLTKHASSAAMAIHNISPIFENPVRGACYAAIASKPAFERIPGLPTYREFAVKMTAFINQFSLTWPVFASLSSLWHTELRSNGAAAADAFQLQNFAALAETQRDNSVWMEPPSEHFRGNIPVPSSQWGHKANNSELDGMNFSPVQRTDRSASNTAWQPPRTRTSFVSDAIDPGLSDTNNEISVQNGMDMTMSGMANSATPAGMAMPALSEASPSFYGDEVDAIFHNLVHLDTTEWTDNREQGLREFGFQDELAFQAFCNDPERVMASNNTLGPSLNLTTEAWPPPGLFPGHFDTPDQMEASRILQSLAGDNNQEEATITDQSSSWWG